MERRPFLDIYLVFNNSELRIYPLNRSDYISGEKSYLKLNLEYDRSEVCRAFFA